MQEPPVFAQWVIYCVYKCDHLSENPSSSHNFLISFVFSALHLHSPRNGSPKFQLIMVSSFGITALESKKSKESDLYSDYTKSKLQVLILAAITSTWISLQSWELAYSVHDGLADQPRYSFSPVVTCT